MDYSEAENTRNRLMTRMQTRLTRTLAMTIAAALLWSTGVFAQSGQFFLTGYQAPEGSITAGGQGKQVVYLRWDVLEGQLPADVVRLQLTRDGQVLLDNTVAEVMSASQIEGLYVGPAQERRLLEMILNMKEDAVVDEQDFAANNFGSVVYDRINPLSAGFDNGWSFLASRNDINIARARYRAFVDDPGVGTFQYELLAVDINGNTARLGYVEVDTAQPQSILPAENFVQVSPASCDLPEMGKDHYSVSLNWEAPGVSNVSDRFAAQIYVGGYDLYRTTANLDPTVATPPARNIAQEAAAANHDTRGVPILTGLEKINDSLLTITPDRIATAEWLETRADLEIVGMKPGDKRAYYLVPRDFTGNYGPTSATIIVVPNLIRPPAPWELRSIARDGNPFGTDPINLTFSWDDVNLDNYLDSFQDGRQYCNLIEAENTGVLEFVGPDENCATDAHRTIRLDVSDYVVYRFLDFDAASKFKDSDADGVADREERAGGTQCDAATQPSGAIDYRLDANAANLQQVILPGSGKETWRFEDEAPAFARGEVLWYRVASRTLDRRLSFLSAPQRGMFPDRTLPPKPIIEAKRPGTVRDGCELAVDGPRSTWSLVDEIDSSLFGLDCPGLKDTLFVSGKSVGTQGAMCENIKTSCGGGPITLTYPDAANPGTNLCTIELPTDLPPGNETFGFCDAGQARLVPTYSEGQIPVEPGEVVSGPLSLSVFMQPAFPDVCMDLYENIDGDSTRVETSCDTATPGQIDYNVPGGFFCGYAVARDGNNNVSPAASAPCTFILSDTAKRPATPQPVSFAVGAVTADLSWRLPIEAISVTLVSLEHAAGDGTRSRELLSVPSPGNGSGDVIEYAVDIPPLTGNSDEYCVRFKSIGPSSDNKSPNSSGWSTPLCETRRTAGNVLPQYLPWPIVDSAVEGTPLDIEIIEGTIQGRPIGGFLHVDLAPIRDLDIKAYSADCGLGGTVEGPPETDYFSTEIWCNRAGRLNAKSVIDSVTPFLVYRQSRNPGGETSDWIQVSPLIEYAHWDSIPVVNQDFDSELNDPYIKLIADPVQQTGWHFSFKDHYTYLPDREYRYQLVYFDSDHRITRWRRSDWKAFMPGAQ